MGLIEDKISYIEGINKARYNLAELKAKKIQKRSDAWEEASGIADQKKDFVRSVVADIDKEIAEVEADIEWYYNMMSVADLMLEFTDE